MRSLWKCYLIAYCYELEQTVTLQAFYSFSLKKKTTLVSDRKFNHAHHQSIKVKILLFQPMWYIYNSKMFLASQPWLTVLSKFQCSPPLSNTFHQLWWWGFAGLSGIFFAGILKMYDLRYCNNYLAMILLENHKIHASVNPKEKSILVMLLEI